jgi:thiol-disulfide isomerase/thioredoxin
MGDSGVVRRRSSSLLAMSLSVGLLIAACGVGTSAVDQTAGGQYRYVGATPKGKVIAVSKRRVAGQAIGSLLDGRPWRLAALNGQVVVVNFWGTWCDPCKIETPNFDKAYRRWKPKGVSFVGIDVKDPNTNLAKSFVANNDITYPIVFDEGAKTALEIGHLALQGLPDTVIVDKHGRVAATYIGLVQTGDLEAALTSLTSET